MPEDPNWKINQGFKQSAHAQEQKMLRKVMDDSGVTRSQARAILHGGTTAGTSGRQTREIPRALVRQANPEIRRAVIDLPPRKAVAGDPALAAAQGNGGAVVLPTTQNSLVVIDGVLYTADVYMDTPEIVP